MPADAGERAEALVVYLIGDTEKAAHLIRESAESIRALHSAMRSDYTRDALEFNGQASMNRKLLVETSPQNTLLLEKLRSLGYVN